MVTGLLVIEIVNTIVSVYNINNDFVSFQSGVSTIVAAINAKAGSNHAATAAPSAIAATVNNLNLGIAPSGTIEKSYTTNKTETFDVTSKASCKVTVNVPADIVWLYKDGVRQTMPSGISMDTISFESDGRCSRGNYTVNVDLNNYKYIGTVCTGNNNYSTKIVPKDYSSAYGTGATKEKVCGFGANDPANFIDKSGFVIEIGSYTNLFVIFLIKK